MADAPVLVAGSQALSAILTCGILGAIGQGIRAVIGLKKAGSLNSTTPTAQSTFNSSYFLVSMMIGFIAGILAGIGLGLKNFTSIDLDNIKPLLGVISCGYAGADFIENSLSLVIPASPNPAPAAVQASAPLAPSANLSLPQVPAANDGSASLAAAMRIVCPSVNVGLWTPALITAFAKYDLSTNRRRAAAIGQFLVEAGAGFQELVENLNYSAIPGSEVFPIIFPTPADAQPYVGNQQAFGNKVYANRLGNGDEASGDGFLFRGRGLIQLTGRTEYTEFGKTVGKTAEEAVQYCETIEGAAVSGCWYLQSRGCLPFADSWNINEITRLVNGSAMEGASQRLNYSNDMLKHLGDPAPAAGIA
jgi:predicted chitinase